MLAFTAVAGCKATIAHLPGTKLHQLPVAVPPIEPQERVAAHLRRPVRHIQVNNSEEHCVTGTTEKHWCKGAILGED